MQQHKALHILTYKIETTNDLLTSRAGLTSITQLIQALKLENTIQNTFDTPKSNRAIPHADYFKTLILMMHEGSFRLDHVSHIADDKALKILLGLKNIPKPSSLGGWLRRMGKIPFLKHWHVINKTVLKAALHNRKGVTLDIDATEIIANKSSAEWTYKKNKGFMPMVGHIAETGQIVSCDFRYGNAPPAKNNLEFIQQCQQALPDDCHVKSLRIDAAGYQESIIRYCDEKNITYAIRAVKSAAIKSIISDTSTEKWAPFYDKSGNPVEGQSTLRSSHCIGKYEKAFTIVIQRTQISQQQSLDLDDESSSGDALEMDGFIYRVIATNHDDWSDSKVIHWYNQRGEASENRIKELKLDMGGDCLPCSDFEANGVYFLIAALSYNLLALLRELLPDSLSRSRTPTLRNRLYSMAGKLVKSGRVWRLKVQAMHVDLLREVTLSLDRFEPQRL